MKKLYCVTCGKYGKFQQSKISYFLEKTLVAVSAIMKMKKHLKKRNQLKH